MASKKPVVTRTVRPAAKTKAPAKWQPWTLPVVLMMLIVGAAGLVFAVREASNAPQAASPVIGPATTASPAEPASSKADSAARTPPAAVVREGTPDAARPAGARPVSITGCVQRGDGGFVLKNTEGSEAPRSRSWKSGFLRRSSATVALVDTGDTARLSTHVGQRVSVTGPLVERDMHVLSLRRIAATCQ